MLGCTNSCINHPRKFSHVSPTHRNGRLKSLYIEIQNETIFILDGLKIPILIKNIFLRQKYMYGQNRYPVAVTLTRFHIEVMKNCSGVCSDDIISISDPKYRVVIVSKSYFGLK